MGIFTRVFVRMKVMLTKRPVKSCLQKEGNTLRWKIFKVAGKKQEKWKIIALFLPTVYCTQALSPRSEVKK
jgi:hypothetical protein